MRGGSCLSADAAAGQWWVVAAVVALSLRDVERGEDSVTC